MHIENENTKAKGRSTKLSVDSLVLVYSLLDIAREMQRVGVVTKIFKAIVFFIFYLFLSLFETKITS